MPLTKMMAVFFLIAAGNALAAAQERKADFIPKPNVLDQKISIVTGYYSNTYAGRKICEGTCFAGGGGAISTQYWTCGVTERCGINCAIHPWYGSCYQ